MQRRAAASAVAVLLAAAGLLAGCSDGSDEPSATPTTATSTPLSEFETRGVSVARSDFCARVAPAAVEAALAAEPDSADTWANGERVEITAGVTDIAHEFGCVWTAADGTTARAWVFTPPVTPQEAEELQRAASRAPGCAPLAGAPAFGSRSVAVRCQDGTTAYHGLFGDAWLSCSLESPAAGDSALLERAGSWCVTVAQAASG